MLNGACGDFFRAPLASRLGEKDGSLKERVRFFFDHPDGIREMHRPRPPFEVRSNIPEKRSVSECLIQEINLIRSTPSGNIVAPHWNRIPWIGGGSDFRASRILDGPTPLERRWQAVS